MNVVQHGEEAYATGEGSILLSTESGVDAPLAVAQGVAVRLGRRARLHPDVRDDGPQRVRERFDSRQVLACQLLESRASPRSQQQVDLTVVARVATAS